MGVRWIRLDVTWDQSEWLEELPPSSQLAWVKLLCYVKAFGVAGSVKKPSPASLARKWDLSRSSIEAMLAASFKNGAAVLEGSDLLITGWSFRQMDPKAAARVKAWRSKLRTDSVLKKPILTTPEAEATEAVNTRFLKLKGDSEHEKPILTKTRGSKPKPKKGHSHDSKDDSEHETLRSVTRNKKAVLARAPDSDSDRDKRTSSPPYPRARTHAKAREDDKDLELEIRKHIPKARENIVTIHGGTEEPVTIEGHKVGVGIEVDVYKRLCRDGHDPPAIIAAAIAYLPTVSDLEPPVSLARWGAEEDGRPIYEQCVGRAYKEATV